LRIQTRKIRLPHRVIRVAIKHTATSDSLTLVKPDQLLDYLLDYRSGFR